MGTSCEKKCGGNAKSPRIVSKLSPQESEPISSTGTFFEPEFYRIPLLNSVFYQSELLKCRILFNNIQESVQLGKRSLVCGCNLLIVSEKVWVNFKEEFVGKFPQFFDLNV
jgi:hypothetical protein